jgi:hypothetical protein
MLMMDYYKLPIVWMLLIVFGVLFISIVASLLIPPAVKSQE